MFKSRNSKAQANSSVDKLLGKMFKEEVKLSTKNTTAVQDLTNPFLNINEASNETKRKRMAKNRKVQKVQKTNEVIRNAARLKIIQRQIAIGQKTGKNDLTSEEKKLINGLIDENVKKVKSWNTEESLSDEIKELEDEILQLKESNHRKGKSQRQGKKRDKEFSAEKMIGGKTQRVTMYPGLTPGLAPVDLDDDSEEE